MMARVKESRRIVDTVVAVLRRMLDEADATSQKEKKKLKKLLA